MLHKISLKKTILPFPLSKPSHFKDLMSQITQSYKNEYRIDFICKLF
jgi:hypothetical protein